MKESKLPAKYLSSYLFLVVIIFCFLPTNSMGQKTLVENGPYEPYGGKREITYSKDSLPVELKQYDAEGNLRRHVTASVDVKQRMTSMTENIFDKKKHLIRGIKKTITYQNDLDYGGKTIYKRYDSVARKF